MTGRDQPNGDQLVTIRDMSHCPCRGQSGSGGDADVGLGPQRAPLAPGQLPLRLGVAGFGVTLRGLEVSRLFSGEVARAAPLRGPDPAV